jgi:hypothetical protein
MLSAEVVPETAPHELFNAQDVGARYCRVASKLHAHRLAEAGLGRGHAEALLVQGEHLQLQLAVSARRHSMLSNILPPLSNDLDHFRTLKKK